jgi:hypothetical protein
MAYTFLVFRGNNSSLILKALSNRPWWENCVQLPAHLKDATNKNMKKIANSRIDELNNELFESQKFNFCWKGCTAIKYVPNVKTGAVELVTVHSVEAHPSFGANRSTPHERQLVNHFSNIETLTTKNGLLRSLQNYYSKFDLRCFDATPTTFICTNGKEDPSWLEFCKHFKDIARNKMKLTNIPWKQCKNNMWILKPVNSNQGQGIEVFKELSKIKGFMRGKSKGEEWIFQKYLERPLLLWGRKFDIRIWVLVTENFDIYIYRNGYIRTSSEPYSTNLQSSGGGKSQNMVHLTNFCMQKHGPNVGKYEDGNTLSFKEFQDYLDEFLKEDCVDFKNDIYPRIKQLVVDSILSAKNSMHEGNRGRHSMELFGFDFMIDEDYRAWLIEVNTNPFLGTQNEWHGKLVANMIEDMVALVIDPMFPPPPGMNSENKGARATNDWMMLCSKQSDGKIRFAKEILSYHKRKKLGTAAYYYPRRIPEAVQRQSCGIAYKDYQDTGSADMQRRYLSSRDRATQEALARVRKHKMKVEVDKSEKLVQDTLNSIRRARTKQRQKARRERRACFLRAGDGRSPKPTTETKGKTLGESKETIRSASTPKAKLKAPTSSMAPGDCVPVPPRSANKKKHQSMSRRKKNGTKGQQSPNQSRKKVPPHTPIKKQHSARTYVAVGQSARDIIKKNLGLLQTVLENVAKAHQSLSTSPKPIFSVLAPAREEDGKHQKVLRSIEALASVPMSNSVLMQMVQSNAISVLWSLCGTCDRNLNHPKCIIEIMNKSEQLMYCLTNFFRVQRSSRRPMPLPNPIVLAHRAAFPQNTGQRDDLQMFALLALLHLFANEPQKTYSRLDKFYAIHTAFYLHANNPQQTLLHQTKELLNVFKDRDIAEACLGSDEPTMTLLDLEGEKDNQEHQGMPYVVPATNFVSPACAYVNIAYAMEKMNSLFVADKATKCMIVDLAQAELSARRSKREERNRLKQREEEEQLAAELKQETDKQKRKAWVKSRLQESSLKRKQLLELEKEKLRKMELAKIAIEREKEKANEKRKQRVEELRADWERREQKRRVETSLRRYQFNKAQDRLNEMSLVRQEENKRKMSKWLEMKKIQQANERQKRLDTYKKTAQARQDWIEQRRERLENLMLNKCKEKQVKKKKYKRSKKSRKANNSSPLRGSGKFLPSLNVAE